MVTSDRLARKDAVGVGPLDAFSENGGARGEGQNMLLVVTRLAGADVIDNHVTDFFRAVLLIRSGTSRNGCLPRGDSWWPIRALPELRALEGIFLH